MSGSQSKASSTGRQSSTKSLLSREEQYKQLNDELTAKTASLVQEAEAVLRGQESVLSKPSLLDDVNSEDLLTEWDNEFDTAKPAEFQQSADLLPPKSQLSSRSVTASSLAGQVSSRSVGKTQAKTKRPTAKGPAVGSGSRLRTPASGVNDVAVIDDAAQFSLQNAISNIEQRLDAAHLGTGDVDDDDVMPSVANEMGSEAQIRFLKAKLRVMQEEMDRLSAELGSKEESLREAQSSAKELEEEKNRLQRTSAAQHSQLDKYKKAADDSRSHADSLETQVTSLRKEVDALKRNQKQQLNSHSATEVRLNQAREDVQKYKTQLEKAQANAKENVDQEKKRVEHLLAENKRLEKQKNELMNGFKKQLKLIDVLKRQKMHIEAAKMLNFTEEEFVKALEWGN